MLMRRLTALLLIFAVVIGAVPRTNAAEPDEPSAQDTNASIGRTPPRLSYANGEVSFWRPGAQDWAPAQVNTPLSPGDELYTAHEGNVELQVAGRAFVRAWGDTQVGLANQEPDFLQIKVTSGHVTADLRTLEPGHTVEIDTPQAAFTIEHAGYYRVDVTQDRTSFITRRSGTATMTPPGGQPATVAPSEQIVLEGAATPTVRSFVAPELDVWDRWNYARTDDLLDSVSARYVSADTYGVDDLDHYGNWRVVPDYGAVWVPEAVAAGWAPYSTGKWIYDPFYGWTWVDTEPWGWAPFHYGRWVFVNGFWAWAPGPLVRRAVYAPALVAFFGAPGIRVSIGVPFVSWVALGWGEPLVPWWGRPRFIGHPWWGGWGGPRVVNNVVVNRTTVVNATTINVYRNASVHDAVVAVRREQFGRTRVNDARVTDIDTKHLAPLHGAPRVAPDSASFVAATGRAPRPPEAVVARRVVATRPSAARAPESRAAARETPAGRETSAERQAPVGREPVTGRETNAGRELPGVRVPAPQIVPSPRTSAVTPAPSRPPFGSSSIERPRPPAPRQTPGAPRETPGVSRETSGVSRETSSAPREAQPSTRETPNVSRDPRAARESPRQPDVAPAPVPRGPAAAPARPTPDPRVEQRAMPAPPEQRAAPAPRMEPRSEPGRPSMRQLPGEPANRLFPGQSPGGAVRREGFNRPERREPAGGGHHPAASPGAAHQRERGGR